VLEARNLTVTYGSRVAVDNVSLTLKSGEVTAVIGPNGAGKSTLLQTLNGHLKPQSGGVYLEGAALETFNRRTIGKRIAVVAQEAELRFPITVLEFVLGGRYAWATNAAWGWETEHDIKVSEAVLVETELTELSGRLMNQLSGGERQRAVLARALATEARNLLLDEPTANLDLSHQSALLAVVRRRCTQQGVAALVVTHDINLAAAFADTVLLIKDGKTIQLGQPHDVLRPDLLEEVFGIKVLVDVHPMTGVARVTPVHD
jgi:ABC-type cobalamin/Fe3+-siderophores transport system ATPase subunit